MHDGKGKVNLSALKLILHGLSRKEERENSSLPGIRPKGLLLCRCVEDKTRKIGFYPHSSMAIQYNTNVAIKEILTLCMTKRTSRRNVVRVLRSVANSGLSKEPKQRLGLSELNTRLTTRDPPLAFRPSPISGHVCVRQRTGPRTEVSPGTSSGQPSWYCT